MGAVAEIGEEMTIGRVAQCRAVVIGAGPYGLSAAAHLKALGVGVRTFGSPMEFWADKMPAGMLLRSPRVASIISDPAHHFTLDAFESSAGIRTRTPLPLETFVRYGKWFQRQLVPDLELREVISVSHDGNGFVINVKDGEVFQAERVVVAAGIGPFQRIPAEFTPLLACHVSHCYEGLDLQRFRGKRVAVIGAGQSALECAALVHESGAQVEVIAKIPTLRWIGKHPWLHRMGPVSSMLYSQHDVGPAGISRLVAAPNLLRQLPLRLRDKIRTRAVRPAGSPWLPPRLEHVKITTGRFVTSAASLGQEAELVLDDGSRRFVDHVLLGTGYSVDISRYQFLSPELLRQLKLMNGYPCLSRGFTCSVPALHFIGATAARSFGPLLYFVAGTEFASTELASYVARNRSASR